MGSMVSHDKGCSWQYGMIEMLLRMARNPPYLTLKRNNFSRGKIYLFIYFLNQCCSLADGCLASVQNMKRKKITNDPTELSSTHFNVNVTFKISITEKCNR